MAGPVRGGPFPRWLFRCRQMWCGRSEACTGRIRVVVVEAQKDLCEEMDFRLQSASVLAGTASDGVALDSYAVFAAL